MDAWDNNTMPAGQADNDALMAQIREPLLSNLGQAVEVFTFLGMLASAGPQTTS